MANSVGKGLNEVSIWDNHLLATNWQDMYTECLRCAVYDTLQILRYIALNRLPDRCGTFIQRSRDPFEPARSVWHTQLLTTKHTTIIK
jgi:hypothetical protein